MADGRRQKEQEEKDSVDEITDAISLTLGGICDSFNSDVLSSLCSLDVTCDRHGNDLAAERVVIHQGAPLNTQPLDDDLRHPSFDTCSADGTVPSTRHSAGACIPERQDTRKVTEGMQIHEFDTPACTLQKGRVKTSGVQETGAPLDLSIHTREATLASVSCIDHTIEGTEGDAEATDLINAGIVSARGTVTSPLNVTSHMKTGLLTTETRGPHESLQHSTHAPDGAKSVIDSGEDHTYATSKRGTVATDDRMAGPLAIARSTVTSPVNVMSPIKNGLVTTDCSRMSRVTPSRQTAATEQDEHDCCSVGNVAEEPLDLSPKQHTKNSCGRASIEPHAACDKFTAPTSDRTRADFAVVSPTVFGLPGEFETAQFQETLLTSKNTGEYVCK